VNNAVSITLEYAVYEWASISLILARIVARECEAQGLRDESARGATLSPLFGAIVASLVFLAPMTAQAQQVVDVTGTPRVFSPEQPRRS